LTDITWSSDGLLLIAASTDGYVSIISFAPKELGTKYEAGSPDPPKPDCYPVLPPKPKPVKKKEPKIPVATTPVPSTQNGTSTPATQPQPTVLFPAATPNSTVKTPKGQLIIIFFFYLMANI